ncbi:hypothetical protein BLNAU_13203 [Blattamonas nauphoetae]|uniref:Uncharacterized protein n=1 Tax=Blattamonas nauphoetae TaxID=2049346 RepID=A0ABQ9XLZ4_9EUKA|nr:hypothetical protein BLNAU_13203 [Blattamonas nauphoetae]
MYCLAVDLSSSLNSTILYARKGYIREVMVYEACWDIISLWVENGGCDPRWFATAQLSPSLLNETEVLDVLTTLLPPPLSGKSISSISSKLSVIEGASRQMFEALRIQRYSVLENEQQIEEEHRHQSDWDEFDSSSLSSVSETRARDYLAEGYFSVQRHTMAERASDTTGSDHDTFSPSSVDDEIDFLERDVKHYLHNSHIQKQKLKRRHIVERRLRRQIKKYDETGKEEKDPWNFGAKHKRYETRKSEKTVTRKLKTLPPESHFSPEETSVLFKSFIQFISSPVSTPIPPSPILHPSNTHQANSRHSYSLFETTLHELADTVFSLLWEVEQLKSIMVAFTPLPPKKRTVYDIFQAHAVQEPSSIELQEQSPPKKKNESEPREDSVPDTTPIIDSVGALFQSPSILTNLPIQPPTLLTSLLSNSSVSTHATFLATSFPLPMILPPPNATNISQSHPNVFQNIADSKKTVERANRLKPPTYADERNTLQQMPMANYLSTKLTEHALQNKSPFPSPSISWLPPSKRRLNHRSQDTDFLPYIMNVKPGRMREHHREELAYKLRLLRLDELENAPEKIRKGLEETRAEWKKEEEDRKKRKAEAIDTPTPPAPGTGRDGDDCGFQLKVEADELRRQRDDILLSLEEKQESEWERNFLTQIRNIQKKIYKKHQNLRKSEEQEEQRRMKDSVRRRQIEEDRREQALHIPSITPSLPPQTLPHLSLPFVSNSALFPPQKIPIPPGLVSTNHEFNTNMSLDAEIAFKEPASESVLYFSPHIIQNLPFYRWLEYFRGWVVVEGNDGEIRSGGRTEWNIPHSFIPTIPQQPKNVPIQFELSADAKTVQCRVEDSKAGPPVYSLIEGGLSPFLKQYLLDYLNQMGSQLSIAATKLFRLFSSYSILKYDLLSSDGLRALESLVHGNMMESDNKRDDTATFGSFHTSQSYRTTLGDGYSAERWSGITDDKLIVDGGEDNSPGNDDEQKKEGKKDPTKIPVNLYTGSPFGIRVGLIEQETMEHRHYNITRDIEKIDVIVETLRAQCQERQEEEEAANMIIDNRTNDVLEPTTLSIPLSRPSNEEIDVSENQLHTDEAPTPLSPSYPNEMPPSIPQPEIQPPLLPTNPNTTVLQFLQQQPETISPSFLKHLDDIFGNELANIPAHLMKFISPPIDLEEPSQPPPPVPQPKIGLDHPELQALSEAHISKNFKLFSDAMMRLAPSSEITDDFDITDPELLSTPPEMSIGDSRLNSVIGSFRSTHVEAGLSTLLNTLLPDQDQLKPFERSGPPTTQPVIPGKQAEPVKTTIRRWCLWNSYPVEVLMTVSDSLNTNTPTNLTMIDETTQKQLRFPLSLNSLQLNLPFTISSAPNSIYIARFPISADTSPMMQLSDLSTLFSHPFTLSALFEDIRSYSSWTIFPLNTSTFGSPTNSSATPIAITSEFPMASVPLSSVVRFEHKSKPSLYPQTRFSLFMVPMPSVFVPFPSQLFRLSETEDLQIELNLMRRKEFICLEKDEEGLDEEELDDDDWGTIEERNAEYERVTKQLLEIEETALQTVEHIQNSELTGGMDVPYDWVDAIELRRGVMDLQEQLKPEKHLVEKKEEDAIEEIETDKARDLRERRELEQRSKQNEPRPKSKQEEPLSKSKRKRAKRKKNQETQASTNPSDNSDQLAAQKQKEQEDAKRREEERKKEERRKEELRKEELRKAEERERTEKLRKEKEEKELREKENAHSSDGQSQIPPESTNSTASTNGKKGKKAKEQTEPVKELTEEEKQILKKKEEERLERERKLEKERKEKVELKRKEQKENKEKERKRKEEEERNKKKEKELFEAEKINIAQKAEEERKKKRESKKEQKRREKEEREKKELQIIEDKKRKEEKEKRDKEEKVRLEKERKWREKEEKKRLEKEEKEKELHHLLHTDLPTAITIPTLFNRPVQEGKESKKENKDPKGKNANTNSQENGGTPTSGTTTPPASATEDGKNDNSTESMFGSDFESFMDEKEEEIREWIRKRREGFIDDEPVPKGDHSINEKEQKVESKGTIQATAKPFKPKNTVTFVQPVEEEKKEDTSSSTESLSTSKSYDDFNQALHLSKGFQQLPSTQKSPTPSTPTTFTPSEKFKGIGSTPLKSVLSPSTPAFVPRMSTSHINPSSTVLSSSLLGTPPHQSTIPTHSLAYQAPVENVHSPIPSTLLSNSSLLPTTSPLLHQSPQSSISFNPSSLNAIGPLPTAPLPGQEGLLGDSPTIPIAQIANSPFVTKPGSSPAFLLAPTPTIPTLSPTASMMYSTSRMNYDLSTIDIEAQIPISPLTLPSNLNPTSLSPSHTPHQILHPPLPEQEPQSASVQRELTPSFSPVPFPIFDLVASSSNLPDPLFSPPSPFKSSLPPLPTCSNSVTMPFDQPHPLLNRAEFSPRQQDGRSEKDVASTKGQHAVEDYPLRELGLLEDELNALLESTVVCNQPDEPPTFHPFMLNEHFITSPRETSLFFSIPLQTSSYSFANTTEYIPPP